LKRIIIGTIPDDFKPGIDIVLGPWCFVGKEDFYPEWEKIIFEPDPFENSSELEFNNKLASEYAKHYINELAELLNLLNNSDYSTKFWYLLVFPWLVTIILTTWERQRRIDQIINKYKNHEFMIELIKDDFDYRFINTLDFQVNGVMNPLFNEWLFSKLIENRVPDKWKVCWKKIQITGNYPSEGNKTNLKQNIKNAIKSTFLSYTIKGISIVDALLIELILKYKSFNKKYFIENIPRAKKSNELKWDLDWGLLIKTCLPKYFSNIKGLSKNYNNTSKRIYVVGPILLYDEENKLKLAHAIENGSRIIVSQHGGNYGNAKTYSIIPEIEYKQFRFITWGWQTHNNYKGKFLPLPSPFLTKLKYNKKNEKIILVGTHILVLLHNLSSTPQAKQQLDYRNNKIRFINRLSNSPRDNLWYRPYLNEIGALSDKNFVQSNFDYLKILDASTRGTHRELMKCKLLVCDHPGTTLNIALAANIPTICFWDQDVWHMCQQAKPYFDALRNVGISFNNGSEAAEKVNEIWDDVEGWWQQPDVQKARKDWARQYASTSKNWRREWTKAILNF